MIISCVGIFILGILFEAIKWLKTKISLSSPINSYDTTIIAKAKSARRQVLETILFAIQLIIGYVLMLIFMSYSIWFEAAVVLGVTTGFFIFSLSL
ncbi:unnamed protein product [Thelazia callipaeda]|uniref:Copper transport protein n=1 Tax=Thelazia callipaeda TaxID=103827 RepID=A0A0N5CQC0_THECL|nr:unnamed protein product [Thelazia callipaeda]